MMNDNCTFKSTERTLCSIVSLCSDCDNIMMTRLVVGNTFNSFIKSFVTFLKKISKLNSSLKSGLTLRIPTKICSSNKKTFSIKEVYLVFCVTIWFVFRDFTFIEVFILT